MSNGSHVCRADGVTGCRAIVGYQFLMCARHWRMVPRLEQNAVLREWKTVCSNSGELHPAYLNAVEAAIAAVALATSEARR